MVARNRHRGGFSLALPPLLVVLVGISCGREALSAAIAVHEGVNVWTLGTASRPTTNLEVAPTEPCTLRCYAEGTPHTQIPISGPDEDDAVLGTRDWWWRFATVCVLISLGGTFAGLTLGLLRLDETNLEVLSISSTPQQKAWAERIKPIRKNGHLLLVTLLLANTVVSESLPVVLDPLVGEGLRAILTSSVLVVIFGEVIPQAVCSRYGLQIGAYFAGPVQILIYIMLPITWPISKTLDCLLGKSHGVFYRRQELKELVTLHSEETNPGGLTKSEVSIIHGALSLPSRMCQDALTPLDKVFMLCSDTRLNRDIMKRILELGYSRIPIHEPGMREHVIGVIHVKRLILVDPDDEANISDLPVYAIPHVYHDSSLADVLNLFRQGSSHIALVYESNVLEHSREDRHILPNWTQPQPKPYGKLIGIITLEDVLEELLQQEINDETDVYLSNTDSRLVMRPDTSLYKEAMDTQNGNEMRRVASVASEGGLSPHLGGEMAQVLCGWSPHHLDWSSQPFQPWRARRLEMRLIRQMSGPESISRSCFKWKTSRANSICDGYPRAGNITVEKTVAELADNFAADFGGNDMPVNWYRRLSAPIIGWSPLPTRVKTGTENWDCGCPEDCRADTESY